MDIFDFEELMAEILGVTDEQREDDEFLPDLFADRFSVEFEDGYTLARALLEHTPTVEAGLSGKKYHAFVSRESPVMLMKVESSQE